MPVLENMLQALGIHLDEKGVFHNENGRLFGVMGIELQLARTAKMVKWSTVNVECFNVGLYITE
jgi:hypothetical protein